MRFRALGRFTSRFRGGDCPLILGLRVMSSNLRLTGELPVSIIARASGSDQSASISPLLRAVGWMGATSKSTAPFPLATPTLAVTLPLSIQCLDQNPSLPRPPSHSTPPDL